MAAANFLAGAAFVKLYWNIGNQLAMNVIGMRVTGNPTFDQTFANTVGSAVKSAFSTHYAPRLSNANTLVRVGVRDWRTANQPEFRDTGAVVPGQAAGDSLPPNTAVCVTLRTAQVGKSARGRCYLPAVSELDNVANGLASTATGTSAVAFLQGIDTALQAQGLKMAVISRPAEAYIITKVTHHNDGTTTSETISNVSQKQGAINNVTAYESRTAGFESQRRRNNSRGALPTSLDPVARLEATHV